MRPKLLMVVFSNLRHDARVLRHIDFVKTQYDVTVLCIDGPLTSEYKLAKLPGYNLTILQKAVTGVLLKLRFYKLAYKVLYPFKESVSEHRQQKYQIIIANDIETLPIAFEIKNENARVVLDAHEYAPRHFENKASWRFFFQRFYHYLCKKYIPQTDGMMTVGKAIAEEYAKNFSCRPAVVTNAPPYQSLQPALMNDPVIRLVHHGIVSASRDLGNMIEMMKFLPEHFTLDLFLLVPPRASSDTMKYLNDLKARASLPGRITFNDPVPSSEIIQTINKYDLGIILIPPINFNYANCLPNKFFEYIQARVGLAIGPTPEMQSIVALNELGVVAESFESEELARKIKALSTQDILKFKQNAAKIAEKLNAESNREIYLSVIRKALA